MDRKIQDKSYCRKNTYMKYSFVLIMILLIKTSFAFQYSPSNISNVTVDLQQKTLNFSMLVYGEISGTSNDHNLIRAYVYINGLNYFDILSESSGNSAFYSAEQVVSLYGQAEDTWGIKKYSGATGANINVQSSLVGDFAYLDFTFPIHPSQLYAPSYTLSFGAFWFDDSGAHYEPGSIVKSPPALGWESISVNNLNASNNSCSNVTLNWQIPSGEVNDLYMQLNADGNVISSGQNLFSYNHSLGLTPLPNDINYLLKVGYGPNFKHAQTITTIGGPPRTGYNDPISFTANNHTCGDLLLEWDDASTGAETETYLITRLTDGVTFNSTKGQSTLLTSDALSEQNYQFKIQSVNECGFESPGVLDTSYLDTLKTATNLSVSETNAGSLKLDWAAGSAQDSYTIIKTFSGGGSETIDNIHKDSTSYVDNNVQACIDYTYRIFSVNDCRPTGILGSTKTYKIIPGLGNTFSNNNFRVSKGYYSNRVELEWAANNNANLLENFVILRRVLGSSSQPTQITSQNASTNFYVDNLTDVGVLYEYFIYGTLICEGVIENTDTTSAIGFRSAFGTLTGQVNYTGGIAVEDVRIEAQSSSGAQGASLDFTTNDSLTIQNSNSLDLTNEITIEMWVKPTNHLSNFTLVKKKDAYSLKHIGSNYVFEVFDLGGTSHSVSIPNSNVTLSEFNQLSAVLYNDTLRIYVNGISTNFTIFSGTAISNNNNDLVIASSYKGKIDEFRFWNIGKKQKTISQDFSRLLSGSDSGLKVYLKMNENFGNYAYDFSHAGVIFNKNHAKFNGSPAWSLDFPTAAQLAITAYTNAQGNYIMVVPYSGIGETFTVSPSFLIHQFSPSTRAIFVGEGSTVHNNIDFEDISSFTVQGSLFYENTSCAVQGATLKVDGNIVIVNGLPAQTDAAGAFNIQVPIGNHFITIEKQDHYMNIGRFPATGTYDFQDDLAGIQFKDSTLVKIAGRVVGGLREAQYMPGLSKSKNNIGTAQIILTSQQGNGCFADTILTDVATGEYVTYAPPMRYIPTVDILSNPTIDFGVLDLLDINTVPSMQTVYDTLGYDSLAMVYFIDSFSFQKQLDYIFRVDPQIVVKDFDDPLIDFMGIKEYEFEHPNGSKIIRNLKTNPLNWPIFDARGNLASKEYKCYIKVFEEYQNLQSGALDSVPTTDGTLQFNNELTTGSTHSVEMKDVNTLDVLKNLVYGFKLGKPNFNENTSIPEYSFTKTLEINLLMTNGTAIPWLPYNYTGSASAQFNTVYDGVFRANILGSKADGQQFITQGPDVPDYVLRDPPGSNSTSTREVGSTKTSENSWNWNLGGSVSTEDNIYLGAKFNVGIGVSTDTDIANDNTLGFSAEFSGGNSGTETITITNTKAWGTSETTDLPGKGSDMYIGKSKNVEFGISETLKLVPDSICNKVECVGSPINGFSFAKTYGVSVVPGGYGTEFFYSENHIKNYLIPDLISLRNAMLQSNSKYTSHLSVSDPNYGLNNDDYRVDLTLPQMNTDDIVRYQLGLTDSSYMKNIYDYTRDPFTQVLDSAVILSFPKQVSSVSQKFVWDKLDDLKEVEWSVMDGNSYTYNAITKNDSLTGDSVRWINNQIIQWEQAIMMNEWEKVNIDNAAIKTQLKNKQLSDLYDRYETDIIAYKILQTTAALITGGSAIATLVSPVPGSGLVGAVTFVAGTGTGIAAAELQEEFFRYQNLVQEIENKFGQGSVNYSISGGNTFTSSISHSTASSYTRSFEYGMSASLESEAKAKINGNGIGFKKSISMNFKSGRDWNDSEENSETVSFTLDDPDQGDYFSVDVYPSLLGWGPVFKLRPGGRTSCPWESALVTEYHQEDPNNLDAANPNSPFFELSAKTLQRDKPTLNVAPSLLTNIPITDAAVFNLTLNNESESNDSRIYTVSLYTPSNPFGAIVKIDGFQPFADVSIPGGTSINKVLTIEKGPGPTYNYDSLMMIIYAPCQYEAGTSDNFDIVDTVYVSAHFLPTCTDVNFATPDDQWVLNNSFQDTMGIGILDYNINFFDFNSIRLDYKPSAQANWIGLQTFHKDTSGMNDPTAIQIPTSTSFTLWDWLTDQVVDGDYDLRLTTQCTLADVTSPTHTGVMDRINPHPFGTPSPADGILDPAEDIKIRFNEPVDLGSLTSLNFDVRGVLNGTETNHASNLYFDGVNDFVEVVAGIPVQSRDFTLEFSVKRAGTGQEAILSQGSDANEQIYVGFNSADQLEFIINNQTVTSTVAYADNDWHYFAVAYSFDNETAEMFEASGSTTASLINNGNVNIYPKYNGADKFNIGKSVANNSHFNGNIDDVRVWNTTRSLSEFAQLKSKMLSSNEPGLLYNWRFDEADGMFVEDHVRARDGQIFGAEWTIEPSGNAISFDGADDYLRINKGDVNITKGMDFTLEFWFNSTQTAAATLVSNGTGTGLASDSLYSWNIAKDAAGKIHVHHNGNDFVAVDSNYFDGQWHHFALVLNRVGNITAYVDGNLQNSVQALAFGELGGSAMYLGARGYYTGTVENFDSHFNGKMDEFRFWDASRKYEQITRDKQNRMKGDEFALRLYMPFENYALDATGIPILSASTAEQIDSTNHIVLNPNGASIINTTPKIKLPRPIQSVAFTYSVNGDEIIITPTTSSEIIENVTLDITVKGVKDLHGNFMESPKTWIAYVDKNQVVWQDDILSFNKPFGDPLSFSTAVVNNGGATKTFTIENIPSWLTVSPISGTITPNSVTPVNVVVDPLMNIGDYVQDIQLLTDFGFPEQLTIDIKVREQEPNWTVNPADYINSMSIIGYLEINNVVSASAEDMLSVFVDGNCRGVAHLEYVPLLDRYLVFLDVYSNLNNGENLEFRIWDASTGTIFTDIIPGNLSFVSNDLIGTVNAPQLFKTNYEISVDIPLNAGWNWVSNFLFNPDSMNIDKTLESLESVNSDEIKGQAEFSNYLSSNGWVGTLNNVGIVPEAGYKLKVANTDTLVLKGDILDPTSRTINLVQGWNWIGFISLRNQNITGALGNLNPTDGDIIKAKSQFAVYNTLLGWVGSLQTMIPGQAYMYKSATNTSFVYPAVGQYKFGNVNKENLYLNKQWVVNHEQFAGNMTSIAQLDTDCDYVLDNNNLTLGVFDSEANCRGTNIIEWLNDDKLSFLTIAGDVSEKLNYSILDNNTGRVFDLEEQVEFSANKHIGDVNSPISLKITDEVCFKMQFVKPDEANDDSEIAALGNNELFQVYPTVFEDEVGLYYLAKNAEKEAEVVLYNIWGQIMYSKNINQYDGFNKVSINFDEVELSKGIYHFVLYSGNEMQSVKLIKE